MKTEIYSIQVSGSQKESKLCTYILDNSPEIGIKASNYSYVSWWWLLYDFRQRR